MLGFRTRLQKAVLKPQSLLIINNNQFKNNIKSRTITTTLCAYNIFNNNTLHNNNTHRSEFLTHIRLHNTTHSDKYNKYKVSMSSTPHNDTSSSCFQLSVQLSKDNNYSPSGEVFEAVSSKGIPHVKV